MENKFFVLLDDEESNSENKQYQCQLCLPRKKIISCHVKSNSNLTKHIERIHPSETCQFKKFLEENKLKRKHESKE